MGKWLGLMIGNSRLHWAYCQTNASRRTLIQQTWDSHHLGQENATTGEDSRQTVASSISLRHILPPDLGRLLSDHQTIPLFVASVVPSQTTYWQGYRYTRIITLDDIPLSNLYPTLGIDRALAILGAWHEHQRPALVVDGGTALTMTGVNKEGRLIGGVILPGLGLQLRSLHQQTAALPHTHLDDHKPNLRWPTNTPDSIRSGVWYGLLAGVEGFVHDWLQHYPESVIVFTGGDGNRLWAGVKGAIACQWPQTNVLYDPQIIFKGMSKLQPRTPDSLRR